MPQARQAPSSADSVALLNTVARQLADTAGPRGFSGAKVTWFGLRPSGAPADSLPPCPVRPSDSAEVHPASVAAWAKALGVTGDDATVRVVFACDAGSRAPRVRESDVRVYSLERRGTEWSGGFQPASNALRSTMVVGVPVALCIAYGWLLVRSPNASRSLRLVVVAAPVLVAIVLGLGAAVFGRDPMVIDSGAGQFWRRVMTAGGFALYLSAAGALAAALGVRIARWRSARPRWQWIAATSGGLAGTLVAFFGWILWLLMSNARP